MKLKAILKKSGVLGGLAGMAVLGVALVSLVSCSEDNRVIPSAVAKSAVARSGSDQATPKLAEGDCFASLATTVKGECNSPGVTPTPSAGTSAALASPATSSPSPTATDDVFAAVLVDDRALSALRAPATYQLDKYWEVTINDAPPDLPEHDPQSVPLPERLETMISEPAPRDTPPLPAPARCPQPGNPSIQLYDPGMDEIQQFLNDGGSVANVEKLLNWNEDIHDGYATGGTSARVLRQDLTGDSVPDVLIISQGSFRYYAPHSFVAFFSCSEGRYEGGLLLSTDGYILQSSTQGLWTTEDMNGNQVPEIVLAYENSTGMHVQILEWDGSQMASLVENPGNTIHFARGDGRPADVDGNGTLELLVLQRLSCTELANRQDRLDIFAWDGRYFRRAYSEELAQSACPVTSYPGWSSYTTYDGAIGNDNVPAVVIAPDGAVWAGTRGAGASRFDGKTWTAFTPENSPLGPSVVAIAVAPDGALWFGSWGNGISRWDGETWTSYTSEDGLVDNRVTTVKVADDGTVWAGTEGGISSFDGRSWTTYTEAGLAGDYIGDIVVESGGGVWANSGPEGILHFDGVEWARFATEDGLGDVPASAFAVAPDGAVWFAGRNVLARWNGQSWTRYGPDDGVPKEMHALVVDGDGVLWAGMANGIARFDGEDWSVYPMADEASNTEVWAIALGSDGEIWVGTDVWGRGLFRYVPQE